MISGTCSDVCSSGRPKVVIIRGDWLSKRDVQYYEPLMKSHDLLGVAVRRARHDLSLIEFPVVRPPSLDSILAALGPVQRVVDRVFRLRSENFMHFWGLDRICANADIIDIAETFHPFCLQAVKIRQRTNTRLVVRVHENIPFAHHNLSLRRYTKAQVFKWADAFITCSEMGRGTLEIEGAPPEKIRVIPMGTDVRVYAPREKDAGLMREMGLDSEHLVLLFAGRITWEKGILDILNAAAAVRSRIPNLRIVILGDGPDMHRLSGWIAERGLSGIVRITGLVPVTRMSEYYSVADVVAVPSIAIPKWQEQFGGVIIEAMACGKVLIVSDSGAIPEVVGDTAIVVPQASYPSLAEALLKLSSDKVLMTELGKRARERAVERFSNEVVAAQIGKLYDELLAGSS